MTPPPDFLVNALVQDRTLHLVGRHQTYEVASRDGFYLPNDQVGRLPADWRKLVGLEDRGNTWIDWPEPARFGARKRLQHYAEAVFADRKITPLEGDIGPVERYLSEHPRVVFPTDWRLFYFDLETTRIRDWANPGEHARIVSYSWHSTATGKSGHVAVAALDSDDAERAIVQTLVRLLERHDIATCWSGREFDFSMLDGRAKALGVRFDRRFPHRLDHLSLFKSYYLKAEDAAVKQSFKLSEICVALELVERKLPVDDLARARGWDVRKDRDIMVWLHRNAPDLLRDYNDADVAGMVAIERKTNFLALHLEICRLSHILPTYRSLKKGALIDGRLFLHGAKVGYRYRSSRTDDGDGVKAVGAFVPVISPGLHDSVAVADYARMYPSIILAANLSWETIDPNGAVQVPMTDAQGNLTDKLVARFRNDAEGHLPTVLRSIIGLRQQYASAKKAAAPQSPEWYDADRLSNACKVLVNSFYGVLLQTVSRFYAPEIGGSITSMGRLLLTTTIGRVRARGHALVFGDTDSVAFPATDAEAQALVDDMNKVTLPALLVPRGMRTDEIRLEYEKRFKRLLLVHKKNYAGRFAVYDGKPVDGSKLEVKGLAMIKSDQCLAARRLQRAFVERAIDGADPGELWKALQKTRDEFEAGLTPVPDLIIRRGMTKDIDQYQGEKKPAQVRVAEAMVDEGIEAGRGSKIAFLVTKDGPIFPEQLTDPSRINLQEYWNKHVYPPTRTAMMAAYPGFAWKGLGFEKGHVPGQSSLFDDGRPRLVAPQHGAPKGRYLRCVRLEVDIADLSTSVQRAALRTVLEQHPGKHVCRIEVIDDGSVVELDMPLRVTDPVTDDAFALALARARVRILMRSALVQPQLRGLSTSRGT